MTYNGWTNYETWLVDVWLTNDEDYNKQAEQIAQMVFDAGIDNRPDKLEELVTGYIFLWYESGNLWDGGFPGLVVDLLKSALESVNWKELIDAFSFTIAGQTDN